MCTFLSLIWNLINIPPYIECICVCVYEWWMNGWMDKWLEKIVYWDMFISKMFASSLFIIMKGLVYAEKLYSISVMHCQAVCVHFFEICNWGSWNIQVVISADRILFNPDVLIVYLSIRLIGYMVLANPSTWLGQVGSFGLPFDQCLFRIKFQAPDRIRIVS